jgi:uncharacterized membrane protein YcaP (DUF421 family)
VTDAAAAFAVACDAAGAGAIAMDGMFLGDGPTLLRTLLIGVLAYAALVAMLRVSGKRTLAKMNAFDFVVTVAIGSTLSSVLINRSVSLAQGALALALLIALQFAITWTTVRWKALRTMLTGEPSLLLRHGEMIGTAMKKARVTEAELRAAVRRAGLADLEEVDAVVLETDGTFSVIPKRVPG